MTKNFCDRCEQACSTYKWVVMFQPALRADEVNVMLCPECQKVFARLCKEFIQGPPTKADGT